MNLLKKIKSVSVVMCIICLQTITFVDSYASMDYYRSSREIVLIQAMELLEKSSAQNSIKFILEHNVKLLFKDMRELGKIYRDHDALSWISDDGQRVVYINQKHSNAPPQALAAIISHEIMHSDRDNSLYEEIAAWQQEGKIWKEMIDRFPDLKKIPAKTYPLLDRLNAILILQSHNKLSSEIMSNVAYRNLPMHSPGF